ncbi:unnamed protein product [Angiostrongylus costaricensis]|uniref:Ovule protein n=1 Tax=Angiostrongylus costaricensis TaxID=334426 RepID=A0A0R3PQ85_ANGCS|nr:unnamed protein product [Angiostrongylus costaricensis]
MSTLPTSPIGKQQLIDMKAGAILRENARYVRSSSWFLSWNLLIQMSFMFSLNHCSSPFFFCKFLTPLHSLPSLHYLFTGFLFCLHPSSSVIFFSHDRLSINLGIDQVILRVIPILYSRIS